MPNIIPVDMTARIVALDGVNELTIVPVDLSFSGANGGGAPSAPAPNTFADFASIVGHDVGDLQRRVKVLEAKP